MKQVVLRWGGTLAILVCAALFFAFRVPQELSALRVKHERIRQLQQENADLAKENAAKRERIRKLRDSRTEQELEIRRRLKLQRPGETSVILEPGQKQ
jgi:cell division protein FtsB